MYNVIDCYDLTVLKANLNDCFYEDYLYPEQFINNVYIKIFKGKELESLIIFKQSSTADNAREYKVNQICLYLDYFFNSNYLCQGNRFLFQTFLWKINIKLYIRYNE